MMKAARFCRTLTTAFIFTALAAAGKAQLEGIHWAYDQEVFNVTPYESLVIKGTFYNDSDTDLYTAGVGGQLPAADTPFYDVTSLLGAEFAGLTLPSGESISFLFARFTPSDLLHWVPPGTYYEREPAFINVNGTLVYSDNTFQINVGPGLPPPDLSTVPEVGMWPIAGSVCCLAAVRLWKRRRVPNSAVLVA